MFTSLKNLRHVQKQNAHGNFNNYIQKFQKYSLRNTQKYKTKTEQKLLKKKGKKT